MRLSLAFGSLKPDDKVSFAVRPRLDLAIEHDGKNCAGFERTPAVWRAQSGGTIIEHCRGQSCHKPKQEYVILSREFPQSERRILSTTTPQHITH